MFNIPFFRRASDTFGLDIGSSAVKVVQLHGSSLIGLGVASLPPDAIAEGTIKDPPSVVEAIKDAVGRAAVGSKEAAIGVSGRELIIKKVQIPEVPVKELRDAVQLEAEHHIPFAIDEVFLDYHVVGRHDGAMDLILVAVKKSKVVEYVGVVEEAGLNAVGVGGDGFALGNQFELNQQKERGEAGGPICIRRPPMKKKGVPGGKADFAGRHSLRGHSDTNPDAPHLEILF